MRCQPSLHRLLATALPTLAADRIRAWWILTLLDSCRTRTIGVSTLSARCWLLALLSN